jgi:hypothetical protein
MERVIGKKVVLHNHNNQIGVVTFFQGNKKPIVVDLLDDSGDYCYEFAGGSKRRKQAMTSNWSWFKINNR